MENILREFVKDLLTDNIEPLVVVQAQKPKAQHSYPKIDAMVYELYGLSDSEIDIVEGKW